MNDETQHPSRVIPVSWEELAEHLDERNSVLRSLLAKIQNNFERNERNIAVFNLGYQATVQIERARSWLMLENDLLAGCARSLYEVKLIICYVLQSDENLSKWIGQFANDEREIAEGLLTLRNIYSDGVNSYLNARIDASRTLCDNLGLPLQKAWNVKALAEQTGSVEEYNVCFKFLSKYIHPSSWIVNADPARTNSDLHRNMLVALIQGFTNSIVYSICCEYKFDELVLNQKKTILWPWSSSSHDGIDVVDLNDLLMELQGDVIDYMKKPVLVNRYVERQDIEVLEKCAILEYVSQRFDQGSRPKHFLRSARLYGAVNSLEQILTLKNEVAGEDPSDDLVNKLRTDLGDDAFEIEFNIGQTLSFDQALEFALSEWSSPA